MATSPGGVSAWQLAHVRPVARCLSAKKSGFEGGVAAATQEPPLATKANVKTIIGTDRRLKGMAMSLPRSFPFDRGYPQSDRKVNRIGAI